MAGVCQYRSCARDTPAHRRDSDRLHRHAVARARSRAGVAHGDARDFHDLLRPWLSSCGFLPRSSEWEGCVSVDTAGLKAALLPVPRAAHPETGCPSTADRGGCITHLESIRHADRGHAIEELEHGAEIGRAHV